MKNQMTGLRRAAALTALAAEFLLLRGAAAGGENVPPPDPGPGENWVQIWETRRCLACGTEGTFWAIFEPLSAGEHQFMTMCLTCGAINGDLPPSDERHWKNIYRTEPHEFTAETVPPTAEAEGRTVCTCARCGYGYTEVLPRLEPEPEPTPEPALKPTPEPAPGPGREPPAVLPGYGPFVSGLPEGTFEPDRALTRAEAAVMLARATGEPWEEPPGEDPFADVPAEEWYAGAVDALARRGALCGREDGLFDPDGAVAREEFARALGLLTGTEPGLAGGETVTRAEAAAAVCRALGREPDRAWLDGHLSGLRVFDDMSPDHWAWYYVLDAANGRGERAV